MSARYSFGGDEQIFVEVDEAMSLDAFFKSLAITNAVREAKIDGVTEICPANASFQIGFNPDKIAPDALMERLKDMESAADNAESRARDAHHRDPRLLPGPLDPRDADALSRAPSGPRRAPTSSTPPASTGFDGVEDFINAHAGAPWFVSMVGFVAGLPFLYQMVDRDRQIEVPKYLRPRTDTPKLTVGYGGCFSCIYSVRGAGGYQMFGITPMPIFDPTETAPYLARFHGLLPPRRHREVHPRRPRRLRRDPAEVEAGRYTPRIADVTFDLADFNAGIDAYNAKLEEASS